MIRSIYKRLMYMIVSAVNRYRVRSNTKYFCIGRNKTGTTSIDQAFKDPNFIVGNQWKAEMLTDKYYSRSDYKKIIDYCKSAEVFQDVPFSLPETYKHLDAAYPGSKFILTLRDDAEQWYRSMTRFHAKKFGRDGNVPTIEDLKNATYVRKGFMYITVQVHGTPDNDPYNKEIMIKHYHDHNNHVISYFSDRPDDLLVLNLSEPDAYLRFTSFIGVESDQEDFPWENKT